MSSQTPKPKGKGAESQVPDDGIPKEIVTFKIAFNIIQNDLSDIVVLYQWVDSANTSSRVMLSADIPKDWTKANPSDSKNLNYSKEFAAVIVEEKFAKNLCSDKFQILFVSKMDQVVQDKIELHYSPLLFPTTEPKFEFTCKSFSNPNIESFTVTVTANKPLLSPAYREHLNPLLITVEAAKNLPVNSDSTVEYIPAYVVCKFFDEGVVKTHSIRASSKCKWAYKQVILLGLMSPIKLTAWIKTSFLEFQVHDRDEVIKPKQPRKEMVLAEIKYESKDLTQEDSIEKTPGKKTSMKDIKKSTPKLPADPSPDKKPLEKIEKKPKIEPKKPANYSKIEPIFVEDTRKIKTTNYGVAQFTLTPFVETDMTTLKLKRNIVPINKHEEVKDELNESGITIFEKPKDSSPRANYLDKESYLSVSFDLAYPIGPLNNTSNSPVKKSTRKAEDNYTSTPKSVRTKSRESKISLDGSKENLKSVSVSQPEEDSKLKFERAVFLFSTNFQHERTEFLKEVRAINLETFGKEETDLFYLGFKKLTEEEKKNSDLDIITGVEFIDKEFHVFIVEGLADKAMKRLGKGFPETHPYDRNIRIIRNDEFKFEDRLYIDFNIDIKKIWFTKNISEIIIQPEIYVRSKVPENIYQTLKTINEIRKCHNLRGVFLQNLFPLTKDILVIEKMYGDTSMYEDLNGNKSTPFRNIDLKSSSIVKPPVEPNSKRTDPDLDVSIEISSRRGSKSSKISSRQAEIIRINEISAGIQKLINKSKFDLYYLHAKNPSSRSSDSEVFIHGNQSLNYYANQRAELRKSIRQDPNNFYTYSKDYMSAAIDPYEIDEVRQEDYKNKKSQWKTPDGFQNVIKKSLDHYISHPLKPVQGKIEAMVEYPWYREKHDQEKMQKQIRGASLKSDRQPDFNLSPKAKGLSHRNDCWPDSPPKIAPERSSSVNQNHKSTNGSPTLEPIKGARSSQTKKLSAPPAEKDLPKPNKDQAPMSIFLTERWRDKEVQYPVDRDFDKRKSPGGVDFDVVNHNPSQFSPVHKRNKKAAF